MKPYEQATSDNRTRLSPHLDQTLYEPLNCSFHRVATAIELLEHVQHVVGRYRIIPGRNPLLATSLLRRRAERIKWHVRVPLFVQVDMPLRITEVYILAKRTFLRFKILDKAQREGR